MVLSRLRSRVCRARCLRPGLHPACGTLHPDTQRHSSKEDAAARRSLQPGLRCAHWRRHPGPLRVRQHFIAHADAADAAAFEQPQEPSGRLNVLPRLKESDPFKILGIPNDSDFEEVQAARNYLVEEYREHEASREHVELAYERIVNESFKARQRKGYRPGRGKRGEREAYELPPTILERFTGMLDKGVTAADAAKDMVVYIALALWAGFAYPLNAAPTMLLFVYAVFRTTKKRTRRKPDGPYFGGSAVFGAVLANLVFMFLAFSTAGVIANALPWWRIDLTTPQVAIFFSSVLTGPLNIWFR